MNINEFVKQHNLIGSLLENISVCDVEKSLYLEIDYCYWQQSNYNDADPETGIVVFKFEDCAFYAFDNHELNSDEIVKVEILDNEISICVESDLTGEYHHIRINCSNVQQIDGYK